MTDPMPAVRGILGMPAPTPAFDYEEHAESLLQESRHYLSGAIHKALIDEAHVLATLAVVDQLANIATLLTPRATVADTVPIIDAANPLTDWDGQL